MKTVIQMALEVMQNQGDVSVDEWIAVEKALRSALAEQPAQPLTDEEWQSIADTLDCCITRGQKDAIEAALGITKGNS